MPDPKETVHGSSHAKVPADPLLLNEDLVRSAGKAIAQSGRKYALLGRVEALSLSPNGKTIEAKVRGDRTTPYNVRVKARHRGLDSRCECGEAGEGLCRHAVAALEMLRFPLPSVDESLASAKRRRNAGRVGFGRGRIIQQAQSDARFQVLGGVERTMTRDERVTIAHQEELQARRQRARREKAVVVLVQEEGGPPRFEVTSRREGTPYVVTLRGPKADLPSCTCPDYTKSELGRCKHSERARAWYLRKKKTIPQNLLSCWWAPRVWMTRIPDPLREIRLDPPFNESGPCLSEYFDDDGYLAEAPEGTSQAQFARAALRDTRELAGARGWRLDLDPLVEQHVAKAVDRARTLDRLATITEDSDLWRETNKDLGFTLHEYQREGSLFIARRGRAFLADDMGLGKTIQAIVASLLLRETVGAERALIVCPASLKHQWRREIAKACGERAVVVEGRRSLRIEQYAAWKSGFLVLNYELVLRDLAEIQSAAPALVILDEAQRIKNWDTKTAKAVKELHSPHAFILTGTPLENRLGELHSLVEFLYPRALGPRWRQRPFHAITDTQGRDVAYEGLDILRKRLSPFFLRRERGDVLDQLPDRTDNTFWTEMTLTQRRPYRRYAAKVASILANNQPLNPGEVRILLQALTSMRILCNALAQHDWSNFADRAMSGKAARRAEIKQIHSPKLEEFENVLEDLLDESNSKVVVFSQWERMLRLAHFVVRGLLDTREERAEVFHGGLPGKKRDEILTRFRDDPALRVMFSTDAGGQGLNLQDSASIVVNLEVPWNPAVLEQRIGRVHRIGQRESVRVLHFVTRGAIEERVRQVLEGKRALFEGLLIDEADEVVLSPKDRSTLVEQVRDLVTSGPAPDEPMFD